ncbi:hypothetical protein SAMN05216389_102277 [Oceanobacillus limi]|uniref:Uncharacterized protein n=1 Tax=Oceanobacillus limi TaxID=930131 RepID=A0A1H9ZK63_9BACI|nr:hypothetical protein [Oceanobacillus limi]SES81198.1 hypothetical protein SAMN05216389_102277 [Oceanobacillus limi]
MTEQRDGNYDQAEQLRNLISEVQGKEDTIVQELTAEKNEKDRKDDQYEIDILDLPPRKDIHNHKRGKIQFKISKPLLRLVFVTLFIVLVVAISIWGSEIFHLINR